MKNLKQKNRKILIPLIVILVLIAGGAGYIFWGQQQTKTASTTQGSAATTLYNAPVTQGTITVSATGAGTLVPSQVYNLGFGTSGTVATVNVQPGDKVKAGQTLASEQDINTLQSAANLAQSNLATAQQTLDTFRQNADTALGNAQLALATAQQSLTNAKKGVKNPGLTRCDELVTTAYYNTYIRLKGELDKMVGNPLDTGYYLYEYVPFKNTVAQAYSTYIYCAGYTSYEIDASAIWCTPNCNFLLMKPIWIRSRWGTQFRLHLTPSTIKLLMPR